MSKKKTKPPLRPAAEPAGPAAPRFWDATLIPFLARRSLLVAVALIALASLRIVSTYSEISPTWDEPGHMACGLQYLAQHVYRYEAQHPPLARVMSALGPFLAGARPLGIKNQDQEGVAVMYHDGHPAQMLTRMRLGILPFFMVAAFVVLLWARRYFGACRSGAGHRPVHAGADGAGSRRSGHHRHAAHRLSLGGVLRVAAVGGAAHVAAQRIARVPPPRSPWSASLRRLGFLPAAAVFAFVAYLIGRTARGGRRDEGAKARALPGGDCGSHVGAVGIWAVYSFSFGKVIGVGISACPRRNSSMA